MFITKESFVEQCRKVHGDKYDYSAVPDILWLGEKPKIKVDGGGNFDYQGRVYLHPIEHAYWETLYNELSGEDRQILADQILGGNVNNSKVDFWHGILDFFLSPVYMSSKANYMESSENWDDDVLINYLAKDMDSAPMQLTDPELFA